jgi:hypothetical protein
VCDRYTEHEFDEALIQTLRETCLKYIEKEHELGLQEIATLIRNAVSPPLLPHQRRRT